MNKLLVAAAIVSGGAAGMIFLPGMFANNKDNGQASISQVVQETAVERPAQQTAPAEQAKNPEAVAPEPAKEDKPAESPVERKEYYAFDPRGEYKYEAYSDYIKIVIGDNGRYEVWEPADEDWGNQSGMFLLKEVRTWITRIDGIYTKGPHDDDYVLSVIIRDNGKMIANIGYAGAVADLIKIK